MAISVRPLYLISAAAAAALKPFAAVTPVSYTHLFQKNLFPTCAACHCRRRPEKEQNCPDSTSVFYFSSHAGSPFALCAGSPPLMLYLIYFNETLHFLQYHF